MSLRPGRVVSSLPVVAAALTGLLVALAILQYQWAGELGEAELERLRAGAEDRLSAFGESFDREVTRAFVWFTLDPDRTRRGDWGGLDEAYARWQARAPYPGLIRGVYALAPDVSGRSVERSLNPATGRVVVSGWPKALRPLAAHLAARLSSSGRPGRTFEPPDSVSLAAPVLTIPILRFEGRAGGRPAPGVSAGPRGEGFVVVLFDMDYLRQVFLTTLEQRYFGGANGLAYALAVFDGRGNGRPVYASRDLDARSESPEASLRLFRPRFDRENQDLVEGAAAALAPHWRRLFALDAAGERPEDGPPGRRGQGEGWGRWRVVLWTRTGGLAEVVAATRERNLLVSFGILLLLGSSVGLLVAAARRAERLARQQMEFVAGVTHELRTPLAVIRSAGENLADGLVSDEGQVQRYGSLVRDEGRRLTEMVEHALEMAGADSGHEPPRVPVDLEELLAGLLKGEGTGLRASGFRVESELPGGLPRVMGDAAALRRALRNLLDNALKYGGDARWIGLRAGAGGGIARPEVWISVEDHGLGIDPEDLSHVFDPFYRGKQARARSIHGSGLGLSLVRRIVEGHGGRVTVTSDAGRGTEFTITLPALRERGGIAVETDAEAHPVR